MKIKRVIRIIETIGPAEAVDDHMSKSWLVTEDQYRTSSNGVTITCKLYTAQEYDVNMEVDKS